LEIESDVNTFVSMDDLLRRLKDVFIPPRSDLRFQSKFIKLRQGKSASVRDFVHELRFTLACLSDPDAISESLRVTIFMYGLIMGYVCDQVFRAAPSTFDAAVRAAMAEDFATSMACASSASRDPHDMDLSMMQHDRAGTRVRCFNCSQFGHMRRHCTEPRPLPSRNVAPAAPHRSWSQQARSLRPLLANSSVQAARQTPRENAHSQ